MERIEPTMDDFTHTSQPPEVAQGTPIGTSRVRFAVRPPRGQRGTVLRSMLRKGELCVTDEDVALIKSSLKLFQRPIETKRVIPRDQIFDAKTIRKYVYFDIHAPAGIQRVFLIASSGDEAKKILEWLPRQTTPAHEAEQTALSSYSERILALTPITRVTYGLIAINVLVYLAMCAGGVGIMAQNIPMTVRWGTNFGPETLGGGWWRLLTSVFVHFGLVHLMFNMLALFQIGRLAERLYGSGRFLALYLFAGVAGSIVSVLWHPAVNSAGASGAIFGVFGGLLVYVLKFRHELPTSIALQQRISIVVLIAYNLFYGFTHQGIDNGAHLGGLVGGVLLGLTLARPLNEPARAKVALKSALLSSALALVVLGSSTYLLAHIREAYNEELQFTSLENTIAPSLAKAMSEGGALLRVPVHTPGERYAIANKIMQEVVPQWEKLYTSFENAPLPNGSPRIALREAILSYIDDNRKMYRVAVNMGNQGREPDAATQAQFRALMSDSVVQVAAVKRLSSPIDGRHP